MSLSSRLFRDPYNVVPGSVPLSELSFDQPDHLARQLVERLGVDQARRICMEHHWHGVLPAIDALSKVATQR